MSRDNCIFRRQPLPLPSSNNGRQVIPTRGLANWKVNLWRTVSDCQQPC